MNPALSQEFHFFCQQEQLQKHATLDKNPYCVYGTHNVTVQYNGGLLPDIILLTQCYFHRGTRLNAIKRFGNCSLWSHLNVLTFFSPLTGGCSEGLGAFGFFFKHKDRFQENPISLENRCPLSRTCRPRPFLENHILENGPISSP